MKDEEKRLYDELLAAFMAASDYLDKRTANEVSGQFRAIITGCRRTGLAIDARIKRIEAAKAVAVKPKRTRKKKGE